MKNLKVLIIILLMSLSIQAQDYILFPDSLATWNSYKLDQNSPDDFTDQQTYTAYNYHLEGDTLINDTLYSKLFVRKSWYYLNQTGPDPYVIDTNYSQVDHPYVFIGGIREDEAKKVWYRNVNFENWESTSAPFPWYSGKINYEVFPELLQENIEVMLYDFNIEIGDSILFHDFFCDTFHAFLDTIVFDEVLDRRTYVFSNNEFFWENISWVEGIGDINSDPFSRLDVAVCGGLVNNDKGLGCFWENGEQIYTNGSQIGTDDEFVFSIDCEGAIFVGIEEYEKQLLEIYPNPSSGEFNIILPENEVSDLMVYDVTGKVVVSENTLRESNYLLDMSSYEDGIYFIQVQTLSSGRYFSKIIRR